MIITLSILATLTVSATLYTRTKPFGKLPVDERLERIKKSPNYRQGEFQNLEKTPVMTENSGYGKAMKAFIFGRSKRSEPDKQIPSQKTDLLNLNRNHNVLVWFGHSSYFMQIDGKRFLVDPVLSGSVSPIKVTNKSFKGTDIYTINEIPEIDYLIITHDHWDHLDFETVRQLRPKVKKVITALGVGSHLERWGYHKNQLLEHDWYETSALDSGFQVTATPGRHFSGRLLKRNQTLWATFVLVTPSKKIFIGGDSGYGKHYAEIGRRFGPFNLAVLECGQYNQNWKYIHKHPTETVQAAIDLQAKYLMPVHWAKFVLSLHAWDESINLASAAAKDKSVSLVTPMIGQTLDLDSQMRFGEWWK